MSTPPPSKNRENQDAATLTQSQPSTLEEVEARAGRPEVARQDGDPFDQSTQATPEDVAERARPGRSRLSEGDD